MDDFTAPIVIGLSAVVGLLIFVLFSLRKNKDTGTVS